MWGRSVLLTSYSISAYLSVCLVAHLICYKLGFDHEKILFRKKRKEEYEKHAPFVSICFIKNKHAPLNLRLLLARSTLDNDSILNGLPIDIIQMIGEKISSVYIEKIHLSQLSCKCFMFSSETKHLYRNESYFSNLSFDSSLPHSYFICRNGECAPSTWGSDVNEHYDKDHPSNIKKLLPTFHELEVIIANLDYKLWGTFTIRDTRVSEYDPPVINVIFTGWNFEGGITKKIKLPPDWIPLVDKPENRYYYLDKVKEKCQLRHPYPDLMDIMVKKLDRFREPSGNFTRNIYGDNNMNLKSFYDILDSP